MIENKRKYNGIEYENSFDLNIGEAFFRTHDPQIGRWWQIDPKPESGISISPYAAMNNNPISLIDPLGDVVKFEREEGVTRKEFRQFKREIREMRRNSESFNAMYKDFKRDKGTFRYVATTGSSGGLTVKNDKGGYDMRISMRGVDPNQKDERTSQIASIAHESGHSFRKKYNLDAEPQPLNVNMNMTPSQTNAAFNKRERSVVDTYNAKELGASHIENIVISELVKSGDNYFSGIQLSQTYFGGMRLDISIGSNGLLQERRAEADLNKLAAPRTKEYYMNTNFNIYTEHGLHEPNN